MKAISAILGILLLIAIGIIVKLKQDQKQDAKKTIKAPSDKLTETEVLLVLHLDEPVGALKRYYNLFPGAQIAEIDIGNNDPAGALAKKIKAELKLPITSGKDPFPEKLLNRIISENEKGQFLHFSNIKIGSSNLGIGSKATTPYCTFPPIDGATGEPIIGQVIPWVKMPGSALPFFTKAQSLGYSACDTFLTSRKEGYVIDPQGFIMLLNGEVTKK